MKICPYCHNENENDNKFCNFCGAPFENDAAKAENLNKETNRRRAYYYEAFTGQTWDDPENYDFCINTDYLGFDATVDLVAELIARKTAQLG